ncbi:16S rRNA (cytidine(1402)-2'-O)-methyltransferase [Aquisalinus flavus]|uniref:Ribosomal RNA small subunit methyltransferase I n=1 Tax=Aquisalinus flavus TaxID=1526572 RepID=A0A8J2V3Q6_9PROT|nr:16S rRNA (cytidine(1402)-2'-O)-methyltransferase [Aquisalinus flavus]MBD0425529.1 16S rRNA (cytidine(1402)-2'-O)-methyltransferase [Aquisalinus flavus]UNE48842.1 16S rRNA (cytidine(1402)-2'-O)-methyltransferase [Aquisalinus flavus]GGD15338.1 ribosomal RNA small subunit methyltransferase I [Aquisalinus flavus]
MSLEPGLYVAATPIGNLKDITLRVIETLRAADLILCEDTRVTGKLLSAHGIKTPMKAYHDHNAARVRPEVLERLERGERLCLVSDAGTPLISDPGYKLVRAVRDAGLSVFTLPGPSAMVAALSIAGAPTDRFLFAGFLPVRSGARRTELEGLKPVPATLVFYESGPRLAACLADMAEVLGPRKVAVARELTKIHEEVREGLPAELSAVYMAEGAPKGEIVVIVHPPAEDAPDAADAEAIIAQLLEDHSIKEAATIAAEQTGLPRKQMYDIALTIRKAR